MPPLAVIAAKEADQRGRTSSSLNDGLEFERRSFYDLFATGTRRRAWRRSSRSGRRAGPGAEAAAAAASLRYEVEDAIATITLDRPDARNALDAALKRALLAALGSRRPDRAVRVVVLTGAGGAFSAGQDLRETTADARPLSTVPRVLHPPDPRDATAREADHRLGERRRRGRRDAPGPRVRPADRGRHGDVRARLRARRPRARTAGQTWFLPRLVGPGEGRGARSWSADPLTAPRRRGADRAW